MNNAQIKSAPCPERLCVRTTCYGLANIVNDNTRVVEHKPLRLSGRVDSAKNCDAQAVLIAAERRQRRPSEKQNNSLKNEGCAIGRKAGNFADDETTGVNGCLLVAIGISADQPKKKPRNKRGCGAGQNFTSAGLWCFSQSFRAASIRVCQPLPVALNASTTSGEQRMVMRVFVVLATGRPRFLISSRGASTTLSPSRSMVSGSDFAAAVMAASSSGVGNFVPGRNLSFDMAFDLPAIGLSEADNAPFVVGAVSKHNTINPVVKVSESDVTLFPVVSPGVHHRDAGIPLKGSSVSKRDTVLLLVYCVFGCIKSYVHTFIVCTINKMSKGDFLPGDAKEKGAAGGHALWLCTSVDYSSGVSDFLRRCRRFISPLTAVTINCAFDSPVSRQFSISSTTSCGILAFSCCDLLFVAPVAISESPCVGCDSVYAKKIITKDLRCNSLKGRVIHTWCNSPKRQSPAGAGTPCRASHHQR